MTPPGLSSTPAASRWASCPEVWPSPLPTGPSLLPPTPHAQTPSKDETGQCPLTLSFPPPSRMQLGDPTLNALEIWGAEYQESNALLLRPLDRDFLSRVSARERCPACFVGTITGDRRVSGPGKSVVTAARGLGAACVRAGGRESRLGEKRRGEWESVGRRLGDSV